MAGGAAWEADIPVAGTVVTEGTGAAGESDEQRQKMQNLLRPARSLNFSMTGAEVDVVDDHEFKLAFMTDGRKLQKSKDASYEEIAAKWDGTRLVSDEKILAQQNEPHFRTFLGRLAALRNGAHDHRPQQYAACHPLRVMTFPRPRRLDRSQAESFKRRKGYR